MDLRLSPRESLSDGIHRILDEQMTYIIDHLKHMAKNPDKAVHEIRKSVKRLRAVLRLIRGFIGSEHYQQSNRVLRDLNRKLSDLRDINVLRQSFADLINNDHSEESERIQQELHERHHRISNELIENRHLALTMEQDLNHMRSAFQSWRFSSGRQENLLVMIQKDYRRGRRKFKRARHEPSVINIHEWRKDVKVLRFQLNVIQLLGNKQLSIYLRSLEELSGILGRIHDLDVLKDSLGKKGEKFDKGMKEERKKLWKQARKLGKNVYREKASDFIETLMQMLA